MLNRNLTEHDPLKDFHTRETSLDGLSKRVHVTGSGPAVIVMTETLSFNPHITSFSCWVRDVGFTVYMLSFFGRDGMVATAEEGEQVMHRSCVSAVFRGLCQKKGPCQLSSVTQWMRALARMAHGECAGPGVGAIGMCSQITSRSR